MISIIKSIGVAFSLYSTLPVPIFDWEEKNMKYAIALFHLVGVVEAGMFLGVFFLSDKFILSEIFFSSLVIIMGFFTTGGIHLDGFCDTCDGIFSHADKQKRLEILKDSHVGAFAIIGLGILFILRFGCYAQLFVNNKYIIIASIGFILSRLFSGLSVLTFKKAKKDGMVATFSQNSLKKTSVILIIIFLIFWSCLSLYINFVGGLILILTMSLYFLYYKHNSYKLFGGVTGDLAGFFLETSETLSVLVLCILGVLVK